MRGISLAIGLITTLALGACDRGKKEVAVTQSGPTVQQDTFVTFTSHLGNSFVAPSRFTSEDKGDTFSLSSPDGQMKIHAIMFTAEGSGTLAEFGKMTANSLLPQGTSDWKTSAWTKIKIGDDDALTRVLVPDSQATTEWRLYVLSTGPFYYAIILNASTVAMSLNGPHYESIVRTFHGVRE